MKISELFESLSPVVFHATSTQRAVQIFSQDTIQLSPNFSKGIESRLGGDKLFYLSLSRTRTGEYHINDSSNAVLIEFDGRKLNSIAAGKAVDYWGEDFRKSAGGAYEQEDRLLSNKSEINGASKFIKRVDILLGRDERHVRVSDVLRIITILKKKNIPFRLYKENRDWVTGSTRNISVGEFLSTHDHPKVDSVFSKEVDSYYNMRQWRDSKTSQDITVIYKMCILDDRNRFSSDELRMLRNLTTYLHDAQSQIVNIFHNSSHRSGDRDTLIKIGVYMKKHGISKPRELATHLYNKWSGL